MKRKFLALLMSGLTVLSLSACAKEEYEPYIPPAVPTKLYVAFYLDYTCHEEYHSYITTTDVLLTPPDTTPTYAMATDPAFPNFLGWSSHTIIDSEEDLWDFETDMILSGERTYLYLYGIWVA